MDSLTLANRRYWIIQAIFHDDIICHWSLIDRSSNLPNKEPNPSPSAHTLFHAPKASFYIFTPDAVDTPVPIKTLTPGDKIVLRQHTLSWPVRFREDDDAGEGLILNPVREAPKAVEGFWNFGDVEAEWYSIF